MSLTENKNTKANAEYWSGRWERGEIGWHQSEVEPNLVMHFSKLKPTRVFVPLCGKSLDLVWLAKQGHEVLGAELCSIACQEFFKELGIVPEMSELGAFKVYSSGGLKLLNGDFFDLSTRELGKIGAVYDRAALIALPPPLRVRYAEHMTQLLENTQDPKTFELLQIVLERSPEDVDGPPFSVSAVELARLYGTKFNIDPLSSEEVDMKNGGTSQTRECVYRLRLK